MALSFQPNLLMWIKEPKINLDLMQFAYLGTEWRDFVIFSIYNLVIRDYIINHLIKSRAQPHVSPSGQDFVPPKSAAGRSLRNYPKVRWW